MLAIRFGRTLAITAVALLLASTGALAGKENVTTARDGEITIIKEGGTAYLGVYVDEVSDGVRITRIMDESAAEQAGLERGDVIVGIGESDIQDMGDLTAAVRANDPGEQATLRVLRDGAERTLRAELGQRPGRLKLLFEKPYTVVGPDFKGTVRGSMTIDGENLDRLDEIYMCRGEECRFSFNEAQWYRMDCLEESCPTYRVNFYGRPMLGVTIEDITPELRVYFGSDEETGLLVGRVYPGSPADAAGIEVGDLIVEIDREPIASSEELRAALEAVAGEEFDVTVLRDGRTKRLAAGIPRFDNER